MKQSFAALICILIFCYACRESNSFKEGNKEYMQITIKEANSTPTVDIKEFTLITNNLMVDSVNAIEILKVKRNLPIAMQQKDSSLFERILAKTFTYRGEDEFYKNKEEYIHNRINATWIIDTVTFQNLTLQFFGEIAILTYHNTLHGTDDTGRADIEYYSWADIYLKENEKWKIGGIHEIESRVEYPK